MAKEHINLWFAFFRADKEILRGMKFLIKNEYFYGKT